MHHEHVCMFILSGGHLSHFQASKWDHESCQDNLVYNKTNDAIGEEIHLIM